MVILEARDVELVQQTVSDLRARGEVARAKAVETVLAVATAAARGLEPDTETASGELLTLRQAAKALSVTVRDIKAFAKDGGFPLLSRTGDVFIRKADLLAYVERLPSSDPSRRRRSDPEEAALVRQQQTYVEEGLPTERVARMDALLEKTELGQRLTASERKELISLEREITAAASARLQQWIEEFGAR